MARKPKAKPVGRPPLPKGERREVYTVRLRPSLVDRVTAHATLTGAVETALELWVKRWDKLSDNQT